MFFLRDAVGVDGEGAGNHVDAEYRGKRPLENTVAVLRPAHFILGDEFFPFGFIRVQADAQDGQRLSVEFLGDLLKMGERFAAGSAPGGPKIEEHDFPLQIVHGDAIAINGENREGRGNPGTNQLRPAGKEATGCGQ